MRNEWQGLQGVLVHVPAAMLLQKSLMVATAGILTGLYQCR